MAVLRDKVDIKNSQESIYTFYSPRFNKIANTFVVVVVAAAAAL